MKDDSSSFTFDGNNVDTLCFADCVDINNGCNTTCTVPRGPDYMHLGDNSEIVIDLHTAEVTIKEGLSISEASKMFWKAVEEAYPEAFKR